jgi:hypothetical protein
MRTGTFLPIRRKMLSGKFRIGNIAVGTKHFIGKSLNVARQRIGICRDKARLVLGD